MDGLQPVPDIGQGAADDHTHGVIQVGHLHFPCDVDFVHIAEGWCRQSHFEIPEIPK